MADNDIPKSAIINPIRSLRIPAYFFQLKKCCTILERFIDYIFRFRTWVCWWPLDHNPGYKISSSPYGPCPRLQKHVTTVNIEKCRMGIDFLDFHGHSDGQGIRPLKSRVEPLQITQNQPQPSGYARSRASSIKELIAKAKLLAQQNTEAPIIIAEGASDSAIGRVLK